jgi:hypothetical protein
MAIILDVGCRLHLRINGHQNLVGAFFLQILQLRVEPLDRRRADHMRVIVEIPRRHGRQRLRGCQAARRQTGEQQKKHSRPEARRADAAYCSVHVGPHRAGLAAGELNEPKSTVGAFCAPAAAVKNGLSLNPSIPA